MKDLASLQRAFQRHVYSPTGAMERAVLPAPRASAVRRLGVYADAYRLRLVEALGGDYPALQFVLGAATFERSMRAFVAAHPSRQANLRWYGGALADYLVRAGGRRPLLAELARFEWALGLAFDAADAPFVSADEVSRIPPADWPAIRLRLHPSVQRLALRTNAPEVWRAAIRSKRRLPARSAPMQRRWLVWRKGLEPCYRALPAEEAWALEAAARGRDFASLAGGLRRFVGAPSAAQSAAQLLRNWIAEGLIAAIE